MRRCMLLEVEIYAIWRDVCYLKWRCMLLEEEMYVTWRGDVC